MIAAFVEGIGVLGPGLADWPGAREVLLGRISYRSAPTELLAPPALPPAERRRVGKGVKLALAVGFEALVHSGRDGTTLASVFASSSGDGDNCDAICTALAGDRLISPTRFHNSVHNAPSGYWGIAAHAMARSTSLCGFDASFAVGLVDAMTQVAVDGEAVLLVAYDAPYPEPLLATRPVAESFGIALVLAPEATPHALARIVIGTRARRIDHAAQRPLADAELEQWRATIPAARGLTLLEAVARIEMAQRSEEESVWLEDVNGASLHVRVDQCN